MNSKFVFVACLVVMLVIPANAEDESRSSTQATTDEQKSIPADHMSDRIFSYLFKSSGDSRAFVPGRYKIFISGLNPAKKQGTQGLWDLFRRIIVVPDMSLVSSGNSKLLDQDSLLRSGGSYVGGDREPRITAANRIQLLPLSGGEYFTMRKSLHVTFVVDAESLSRIQKSLVFKDLKIHLVPEGAVGKVNINTAPVQTLLRIPGFSTAIDPQVNRRKTKNHVRSKHGATKKAEGG